MTRFNTKIAAGVLTGLGLVYMIVSLITGRFAVAADPPDLEAGASQTELGIWQAANMLVMNGDKAKLVDLRRKDEFERYHVPGSVNVPDGDAREIGDLAKAKTIILLANKDEDAARLSASAGLLAGSKNVFYLKGGARTWYLTFHLPVPLFSDKEIPFGYEEAMATVRAYFDGGAKGNAEKVSQALSTLARLEYGPSLLGQTKKAGAGGAKRKKISGGCG